MSTPGTKDTGGQAFPISADRPIDQKEGMTLRDWMAGQALAGILSSYSNQSNIVSPNDSAKEAYGRADAMIQERNK